LPVLAAAAVSAVEADELSTGGVEGVQAAKANANAPANRTRVLSPRPSDVINRAKKKPSSLTDLRTLVYRLDEVGDDAPVARVHRDARALLDRSAKS
jgi:hypothetical protein